MLPTVVYATTAGSFFAFWWLVVFDVSGTEMNGLPRGYDNWRTQSDTDEQDDLKRQEQIRQAKEDRADSERDRMKDEKASEDYERRNR